jgi:hypothetical protein
MPTNDALGAKSQDKSVDWSNAFEAVSRLAAAREATMHNTGQDRRNPATTDRRATASGATARPTAQGIDPDQLARAVAEIEKASAALRRSDPALEVGPPVPTRNGKRKRYLSVWILIAGIWISATLVVAVATAGILYVLR